mgnify:CR=1 FL=1
MDGHQTVEGGYFYHTTTHKIDSTLKVSLGVANFPQDNKERPEILDGQCYNFLNTPSVVPQITAGSCRNIKLRKL